LAAYRVVCFRFTPKYVHFSPNTDQQYWPESANQCFMLPIRLAS
jgi:hypothetical protein